MAQSDAGTMSLWMRSKTSTCWHLWTFSPTSTVNYLSSSTRHKNNGVWNPISIDKPCEFSNKCIYLRNNKQNKNITISFVRVWSPIIRPACFSFVLFCCNAQVKFVDILQDSWSWWHDDLNLLQVMVTCHFGLPVGTFLKPVFIVSCVRSHNGRLYLKRYSAK